MSKINLTASNRAETRILDYLEANASDVLAEKINAGGKSLAGAVDYAKEQAKADAAAATAPGRTGRRRRVRISGPGRDLPGDLCLGAGAARDD